MYNTGHWLLASDCTDKLCWIILGCFWETGCETSCLHQVMTLSRLSATDAVGQTEPQEIWLQAREKVKTWKEEEIEIETNREHVVGEIRDREIQCRDRERWKQEKKTPCAQEIFILAKTTCVILILWFSSSILETESGLPTARLKQRTSESFQHASLSITPDALREALLVPG